jgi:hypothetical protein
MRSRNGVEASSRLEDVQILPASFKMPTTSSLLGFALASLGVVLTSGPNMIYLISRSITQGPAAGIVSLGGWRGLSALDGVAGGEARRPLAVPGEEARD